MRAGLLRHRVTIQAVATADDGAGGSDTTWSAVATLWAEFVETTGREFMKARQVTPELTHLIRIRYRPDITPKHRVLFAGRALDVKFVANPMERNRELLISCVELPQEGS